MKRLGNLFFVVVTMLFFSSCTENQRLKNFGGNKSFYVNKGHKCVQVTWKDDNMWMLTREMTNKDVPETYYFKEESSFGMLEGTIRIIESR